MTLDSLRILRNVLLRSFAIGALIYLFSVIVTYGAWHLWTELASKWILVDEAGLSQLVLRFFVTTKFFLIFILLTPGLAIHWTIKAERAKKS